MTEQETDRFFDIYKWLKAFFGDHEYPVADDLLGKLAAAIKNKFQEKD